MVKSAASGFTDREAEIMRVLWNLGKATAEQVRLAMQDQPHDSTVRTFLRILIEKGHVKRADENGTFVYSPAAAKSKTQRRAVGQFLDRFFSGSAEDLVLRLLDDKHLTPEQLKRLSEKKSDSDKSEPSKGSKS